MSRGRIASCVLFSSLSTALWTLPTQARARGDDSLPECFTVAHELLAVNNDQVRVWQQSTPNQFHSRAHIHGSIVRLYSDHSGHNHLSVQIGANADEAVEVIYNQSFGSLPELQTGSVVEACGDYITSNASTDRYPASPDGAIVHWIHESHSPHHESGYLAIDGILYGN